MFHDANESDWIIILLNVEGVGNTIIEQIIEQTTTNYKDLVKKKKDGALISRSKRSPKIQDKESCN